MMETNYAWKPGARFKVAADIAGRELEACANENGYINPQLVVDRARDERSPIHEEFEWDDAVAANEHRKAAARCMTACLVTTVTRIDLEPLAVEADIERTPSEIVTRAFVHVNTAMGSGYRSIGAALGNDTERSYLLKQARNDMKAFETKYSMLGELAQVIKAMRDV
jgi:hypothetical protein